MHQTKCLKCPKIVWVFKNEDPFCFDCYIPKNPTNGWRLSKARTSNEFSEDYYSSLTDARQKTYLLQILKKIGINLDENTEDTEKDHSKDDR